MDIKHSVAPITTDNKTECKECLFNVDTENPEAVLKFYMDLGGNERKLLEQCKDKINKCKCGENKKVHMIETANEFLSDSNTKSFEDPNIVKCWIAHCVNEYKYDKSRARVFLGNWLLKKQKYIRDDIQPNKIKKNLLYCYKLEHYIIRENLLKKFDGFYEVLSIMNKNTIVELNQFMLLELDDIVKIDVNFEVELLLESYL